MCGFAGLVVLNGLDRAAVEAGLTRALARLRPRGPDMTGRWLDERCALANARLAVQDLSEAGRLPMARDGLVLAYNGEIYNFPVLRRTLEGVGERFHTGSDSEVLLAGWRQWGERLLPKLEGMFAFALWQPEQGALVLARDRYGKKPLLYRERPGGLAFASELAALEALTDERPPLDPAALRLYWSLRYVPEPFCIASGTHKLPAGHLARFSAQGFTLERWHDWTAERPPSFGDPVEARGELVRRFDEAVRRRLIADVPLGVFLSGGIDSALVAAAMVRQAQPVKSFTVGFAGAADYYEERPAARVVARHLGTLHTEIEIAPGDALGSLDQMFDGLDEPFADSSALPTFLLARETRRHVTVALSGDGGDEVFAGYRKYQGELRADQYQRIPRLLRRGLIEPLATLLPERKSNPLLEHARRVRRFLSAAGLSPDGRQAGWLRLLPQSALDALLLEHAEAPTVEALVVAARAEANEPDAINRLLRADMALGLASDMLVKMDRMSMANSLEVRSPFLDHAVVDCAFAMPGSFKLAPGQGKKILRDAFADRLPAEVFTRPKKGFEMPIAEWLCGPLDDLVAHAIDPVRLKRQGLFRPDLPRRWLTDLQSRRRDRSEQLWTLIAFQAWVLRFRPGLSGEP
jgi:asparagine synthase (glutamine-hydrolysing)